MFTFDTFTARLHNTRCSCCVYICVRSFYFCLPGSIPLVEVGKAYRVFPTVISQSNFSSQRNYYRGYSRYLNTRTACCWYRRTGTSEFRTPVQGCKSAHARSTTGILFALSGLRNSLALLDIIECLSAKCARDDAAKEETRVRESYSQTTHRQLSGRVMERERERGGDCTCTDWQKRR